MWPSDKNIIESERKPAVPSKIVKESFVLPNVFFNKVSWSDLLSLHPIEPVRKSTWRISAGLVISFIKYKPDLFKEITEPLWGYFVTNSKLRSFATRSNSSL